MFNGTVVYTLLGGASEWTSNNISNLTSNSSNSSQGEGEVFVQGIERWLVPLLFSVIVLGGCVGNILVLIVVLKNKDHYRNTTNLFIVNLAIADLLYLVFCAPFHSIIYTVPSWPFGEFTCKFVHLVQYSSMVASVLTLVAMSADRFLAVGYPLLTKHVRTPCVALSVSLAIWVVSLAMAAPWPVYYTVKVYTDHGNISVCADDWGESKQHRSTYFLILFLLGYVIPLTAIMILSSLMVKQLWAHPWAEGPGMGASIKAKRKVTRIIIVVVLVFCVCWLPTHVIWIWTNYFWSTWKHTYPFYYLRIFAHLLSYANSSLNPVIYAFLSSQFRKGFNRAIHCASRHEVRFPPKPVYSLTQSNEDARPPSTANTCV